MQVELEHNLNLPGGIRIEYLNDGMRPGRDGAIDIDIFKEGKLALTTCLLNTGMISIYDHRIGGKSHYNFRKTLKIVSLLVKVVQILPSQQKLFRHQNRLRQCFVSDNRSPDIKLEKSKMWELTHK